MRRCSRPQWSCAAIALAARPGCGSDAALATATCTPTPRACASGRPGTDRPRSPRRPRRPGRRAFLTAGHRRASPRARTRCARLQRSDRPGAGLRRRGRSAFADELRSLSDAQAALRTRRGSGDRAQDAAARARPARGRGERRLAGARDPGLREPLKRRARARTGIDSPAVHGRREESEMPYKPGDLTKGAAQRVRAHRARCRRPRRRTGGSCRCRRSCCSWRTSARTCGGSTSTTPRRPRTAAASPSSPSRRRYRTYDGSQTDPDNPDDGQDRARASGATCRSRPRIRDEQSMLDPSPREVSNQLLNRDTFKPATTLNVLAACWLQFQNHDWFSHGDNSETEFIQVPLRRGRRLGRRRDGGPAHEPGLDQRRRQAAADLRQQGHAVVGRLAALRLDRGAQPRAARRRGRQAHAGGRPPARGDQARRCTAST